MNIAVDQDRVLLEATKWGSDQERWISARGDKLTDIGAKFAAAAGVIQTQNIRVLFQRQIPEPQDVFLKSVNAQLRLITKETEGLTLGHGIFIRSDRKGDNKLLVHEFAHVAQVERFGGLTPFLTVYLHQCFDYGYFDAPLEVEARAIADRLIPN